MKPWSRYWGPASSLDVDKLAGEFQPVPLEVASRTGEGCALLQAETGYCYTWSRLSNAIRSVAGWLQGIGVGKGSQVAVSSENLIEALAFTLGAMAAGARVVLIDPLTVGEDLRFQLEGRLIKVLAGSRPFLHRAFSYVAESGVNNIVELAPGDPIFKAEGGVEVHPLREVFSAAPAAPEDLGPLDDAFAIYYAGIAGRTMQVVHSHIGLWLASKVYSAVLGIKDSDSSLLATPFTHVLGLQASLVAPLLEGAPVVALARWSARIAGRLVSEGLVSYIAGVPLMFQQLLEEGVTGLKHAVSAGAPLDPSLQRRFNSETGTPLLQGYGMSESLFLTLQTRLLANVEGTIGVPLPGVEIRLRDPSSSKDLPLGSTGELLVKAPWVMKGYEYPEENSKAFSDGWLVTGDIVEVREDGVMFFRGVKKRIIKYKGYAILLGDLEYILESHPDVVKARVYGEPAGDVGQVPVAEVWLRRGSNVKEDDLLEYVNSRVAFYKKLRRVKITGYL